ncbi:40S small subunit processome assembly factor 1 [Mantella aurantiaca]
MAGGEEQAADVHDQLESVLTHLYDFGEDFECTNVNISESDQQSEDSPPDVQLEEVTDARKSPHPILEFPIPRRQKKNPSFFFNAIKDELRSQPKSADVPSSFVSKPHVEVVRYVSRKNKKQAKSSEDSMLTIDSKEEENIQTIDFEKARLEVHKFGITGYKKEKQRKFEQERAIMLGAKPPKREYVNYKVYQERMKEQEEAKKERSLLENLVEPVKKKQKQGQKVRRPRKSKGSSGFVPDGQVGRYRDGALILSTKDIHKIKQSKASK